MILLLTNNTVESYKSQTFLNNIINVEYGKSDISYI